MHIRWGWILIVYKRNVNSKFDYNYILPIDIEKTT